MPLDAPADVRTHLTTSRQLLIDEHAWIGHREECLRLELDTTIAQRASVLAAIIDLDRLLDAHFAITPAGITSPVVNQIGDAGPEVIVPPAKPAAPKIDGRAAAGKEMATCDCGRTMSKLGLPRHRAACPVAQGTAPVPPSALMQGDADTPVQSPPDSGRSRSRAESPVREPARTAPVGSTATAASSDAAERPTGDTTPKKTGRPRTVDYDEAAQVITDGYAAGQLPLLALMKHYNKPPAFANSLIRSLRRVGLMPDGPKPNIRIVEDIVDPDEPSPPATPPVVPPAAEVADTFREAVEANRRPIQTIVDRYDCTREQAQEWVDVARAAGELPPKGEPVLPASDAPIHFVPRG